MEAIEERTQWGATTLQETAMPMDHEWTLEAERDGINGHVFIRNKDNPADTAIVVHRRWKAGLGDTRTTNFGVATTIDLHKGEKGRKNFKLDVASWHLPNRWNSTEADYREAVQEVQAILREQRLVVGMDANTELDSQCEQEAEGEE